MCRRHKKPMGKESYEIQHAMKTGHAHVCFLLLRNTAYTGCATQRYSNEPKFQRFCLHAVAVQGCEESSWVTVYLANSFRINELLLVDHTGYPGI